MKLTDKIISKLKDQRGVSAIIVAIVLSMLIGFLALAIDIGYLYATKNELQNTADAAALAATGYLGQIYKPMTSSEIKAYDCSLASSPNDCGSIKAAAKDVVGDPSKNLVAGKTDMMITDGDITLFSMEVVGGNTHYGDNPSDPDITTKPDAVRVIVRREEGVNGPIVTFFARIFGIDTAEVTADATAALTGVGKIVEGGLPIPVGIAKARFDSTYCEEPIKFYPTNDLEACGGWHVYEDDKTKIKQDVLTGLLDGADPPFISPEAEPGDIFYFKGGTDNAAYTLLKQVFDEKKLINDYEADYPIDGDNDSDTWTTSVVVYDWDDCSNPNTFIPIIGFAKIRIYEICTATSDPSEPITGGEGTEENPGPPQDYCVLGEKQIVARIVCDIFDPVRGGGGSYGTMGSIPGLVE